MRAIGITLTAISLALLVAAAACGGGADRGSPAPGATSLPGQALTVLVRAEGIRFSPTEIQVPSGVPLTISLVNVDLVEHDFTVDGIEIAANDAQPMSGGQGDMDTMEHGGMASGDRLHVHAEAGSTASGTFVLLQDGTYTVYCTVSGHREAGMVGTLVVT